WESRGGGGGSEGCHCHPSAGARQLGRSRRSIRISGRTLGTRAKTCFCQSNLEKIDRNQSADLHDWGTSSQSFVGQPWRECFAGTTSRGLPSQVRAWRRIFC